MKKTWFHERFFFEVVMVMVKDEKIGFYRLEQLNLVQNHQDIT